MAPKPDSLYQAMLETYANPQSPNEQIIHDALLNGRKVLDNSVYLGADNLQNIYAEYLPDGSIRRIIETVHLDGSKDTQIRYLDPVHLGVFGTVDTHTDHGVETVVGVNQNVPGSIDLHVGDTRPAANDVSSAAGLVPNSWNPHDDYSDKTATTSGNEDAIPAGNKVSCWENTGPNKEFEQIACSPCSLGAPNAHEDPQTGVCVQTTYESTPVEVIAPESQAADDGVEKSKQEDSHEGNHDGSGTGGNGTGGGSGDGGGDGDDGNGTTGDEGAGTVTGSGEGADGALPNPEDGGGGSPNSTPNPEGGDDGGEDNHHGPTINRGTSVGHLSTPLAAVANGHDATSTGNYHGPHDPGEEMPNPEDTGGGSPVSNIAHSMRDFWSGAAAAIQGESTGLHLPTFAVANHAAASLISFNTTAMTTAHDAEGAHSDTSSHAVTGAHDLVHAHSDMHAGLGMTTLHDTLTLHDGSFATQILL